MESKLDAAQGAHDAPIWFRSWGWIHRPVAVMGWVAVSMAVAFCVQVFLAIDRHSHSASDTLYGVFPYIVPSLIVLEWLASKTSGRPRARSRQVEPDA